MYEGEELGAVFLPSVMRENVFIEFHRAFNGMPDHVFGNRWSNMISHASSNQLSVGVLRNLARQFLKNTPRLAVQLEKFGDWQNLLSRISGLPVHSALLSEQADMPSDLDGACNWVKFSLEGGAFILPHEDVVEGYVSMHGLNETHLHLNGSTPAEICWQRALLETDNEIQKFGEIYNDGSNGLKVAELCHCVDPNLTPMKLAERLRAAVRIRAILIRKAIDPSLSALSLSDFPLLTSYPSDLGTMVPEPSVFLTRFSVDGGGENCVLEATWISLLLRELHQRPDPIADKLLHHYLLILNQYVQLMVQRDDFYGFDQFQKFTLTDLRAPAEAEYKARFWQLHGAPRGPSRVNRLEGRFAPKATVQDNLKLLTLILKGYARYLFPQKTDSEISLFPLGEILDLLAPPAKTAARKMNLALVAHFIKREWTNGAGYRHADLRENLKRQCDALVQCMAKEPRLNRWLRGVDAAANELHAGPEVFAPIFRVAHRNGLTRRTFHVGEDFIHIVGGMRQIHDAVTLLNLSAGDRLGHCTAIGITPKQWLNSMPHVIVIKRGDWMLDMLFAWNMLQQDSKFETLAQLLEREVECIASQIFGESIPILELREAMSQRGLWPLNVFHALDNPSWDSNSELNDAWREEARLVANTLSCKRPAMTLLANWWRNEAVIGISEQYIEVRADIISAEAMLKLQQLVMEDLTRRDITVETLPTSNVRISQYRHIREHHVFRWMPTEANKIQGDPMLQVSLGSDDPGIFVVDIVSEIYHLYGVLIHDQKMERDRAMELLKKLNERGYKASFH